MTNTFKTSLISTTATGLLLAMGVTYAPIAAAGETCVTDISTTTGVGGVVTSVTANDSGATANADVDAFACGQGADAGGVQSTALGADTDATGTNSVAIGWLADATAVNAIAVGRSSNADAPQALAVGTCLLYTSPSPRDKRQSRMPSSA